MQHIDNTSIPVHANLLEGIADCLYAVFSGGQYTSHALERLFRSKKQWGSRDRKFVAETVYDVVRWRRLLQELGSCAGPESRAGIACLTSVYFLRKGIPAEVSKEGITVEDMEKRYALLKNNRAVRESVPDWLDALGLKELGEAWEEELHALNSEAKVVLRTNTLKIKREELAKSLEEEGIAVTEADGFPDALVLKDRRNIFVSKAFREGYFEVQDAASQSVAVAVAPEPGMTVVDACAGGGGKTLHLAALMRNKGRILALDTDARRLEELRKRARRAGAHIIETREITSSKIAKRLEGKADRVLLDVPCTGLGVLRRNPDTKWKLSPEAVQDILQKQAVILQQYARMVKPGGLLVYATCSILPSENELQVRAFLENRQEQFKLLSEKRFSPAKDRCDGFYVAVMKRND